MTVEKSFPVPKVRYRRARRRLSLAADRSNTLCVRGTHVREKDKEIICAEGFEMEKSLPAGTQTVYSTYGHGSDIYAKTATALIRLSDGTKTNFSEKPKQILRFLHASDGSFTDYAIVPSGIYGLRGGSASRVSYFGGTCGAVHFERIFTAIGNRIRYSEPLEPTAWNASLQGAGYVDLPSEGGNVIAAISYRDKLFFFRERGITQLKALGDVLKFQAVSVPFACGEIIEGSVQNCGKYVVFFTRSGLFAFNGEVCFRLSGCKSSLIEPQALTSACSYGGKYYACVTMKSGEKQVYCADPVAREGHFLNFSAEGAASSDKAYFVRGEALYSLTDCGFPPDFHECAIKTPLSGFSLPCGQKFLDSVTIEGEGYFHGLICTDAGRTARIRGSGGEQIKLVVPLRGNSFSFELHSYSENMRVSALTLAVREVRN